MKFPNKQTADDFLRQHWQKKPLLMPAALPRLSPTLTRNDLAWLATHDDVESRIVFREDHANQTRYRVEQGPFSEDELRRLPKRNWTLLVHDIEKHLPVMRRLLRHVDFVPDWRIDDLMISFAAPGGGVGPHRDNYDVFLCQGIGVRQWSVSEEPIAADPGASDDLLLLKEFEAAQSHACRAGDVLYLPPQVAHWGVAQRACMTYSIGMRAPLLADVADRLELAEQADGQLYVDPHLSAQEAQPGLISKQALRRLCEQLSVKEKDQAATTPVAIALGEIATETKVWLTPSPPSIADIDNALASEHVWPVHGMARLAFDDARAYINGQHVLLPEPLRGAFSKLCEQRRWQRTTIAQLTKNTAGIALLRQLAALGAFDLADS